MIGCISATASVGHCKRKPHISQALKRQVASRPLTFMAQSGLEIYGETQAETAVSVSGKQLFKSTYSKTAVPTVDSRWNSRLQSLLCDKERR